MHCHALCSDDDFFQMTRQTNQDLNSLQRSRDRLNASHLRLQVLPRLPKFTVQAVMSSVFTKSAHLQANQPRRRSTVLMISDEVASLDLRTQ